MPESMGVSLILTTTNGEAANLCGNDWLTTVEVEGHWHIALEV